MRPLRTLFFSSALALALGTACGPHAEPQEVDANAEMPLTGDARIRMKVTDRNGDAIPESWPIYFVVMDPTTRLPVIKRARGTTGVDFTGPELSRRSFLGLYYPDGLAVKYRTTESAHATCKAPDAGDAWHVYDVTGTDRARDRTLQLSAGLDAPTIANDSCLVIEWQLDDSGNAAYSTSAYGLEDLANQVHVLHAQAKGDVPVSHTIDQAAPGSGKIRIDLSEDYGAVPVGLFIGLDGQAYLTDPDHPTWGILDTHGLASDSGMQNSVLVHAGATGLYASNDAQITFPSNQLGGHAHGNEGDANSFSPFVWGMKDPLAYATPNAITGADPTKWIPMYSDNAVSGVDGAAFTVDRGGTFPFFRPRSVHGWDGKLDEATLSRYEKNGATVERMAYRFDYRVDRDFEAVAGKSSRVEFKHNLVLQRRLLVANHAVAYLVWNDGSISTSINVSNMNCNSWRIFTKDRDCVCTNEDPDTHLSATIDCDAGGPQHTPKVERVVVDYADYGVAFSQAPNGTNAFARVNVGNNASGASVEAFNVSTMQNYFEYSTVGADYAKGTIFSEGRDYYVGPLSKLRAAGVGPRDVVGHRGP